MRKKGTYTSGPDPDLDFLRQKQKRVINKTKRAWMWSERPAGLCQFDNPRSRPVGPECEMGDDSPFTQAEICSQDPEKWDFFLVSGLNLASSALGQGQVKVTHK